MVSYNRSTFFWTRWFQFSFRSRCSTKAYRWRKTRVRRSIAISVLSRKSKSTQGIWIKMKSYRHISSFFICICLHCIKSFNFIFSAILVMLCMHTKGLYKFQYKEKFVYSAYMKLVGPMSYFYNGRMLLTHFCSLNVIQDGQKVSIAIFHQVCQFYNILFEVK